MGSDARPGRGASPFPLRLLGDLTLDPERPLHDGWFGEGPFPIEISDTDSVVLVPVPAGVPLRVSLGARRKERPSALELVAFPIARSKEPAALARIVDWQLVPGFGGPELPVTTVVRQRLTDLDLRRVSGATLADAVHVGGFEWIDWPIPALPEPDVLAVVVRGPGFLTPPRLRLVVDRDPSAPELESGSAAVEGTARRLVDGEERVTRPLRGGEAVSFDVALPAAPSAVTFGVSTDAPDGARWRLHVGDTVVTGASEGAPGFVDVAVPWPPGAPGSGDCRLEFTNVGDGPLLLAQPVVRGGSPAPRKNLLLISLDTLRADRLSCYGHDRPTSPFLDRFAAESIRFERCLAPSSHTLPSHASLFTGRAPLEHGVVHDGRRLDPRRTPTLPRHLARAGYATAAWTGGGYVSTAFGFAGGFDRFFQLDPVSFEDGVGLPARRPFASPRDLDDVATWIEARGDGEPWFAFVHTYAIHGYRAPADVFAAFDTAPDAPWRGRLEETLKPTYWRVAENAPTAADVRHLEDLYDASIRAVDARLEAFFERLERAGGLDDTVVVVTSDHGEEFFEHGGLQHGLTLYDEQLHVPLLVRLPAGDGRVEPTPFQLVDLAPTLLERMGLPPLEGATGVARPLVLGADSPPVDGSPWLFSLDRRDARVTALRFGRYKLIRAETGDDVRFPAAAAWQLFDLRDDPGELHDLAGAHPSRVADLRRHLEEAIVDVLGRASRPVGRPANDDVDAELRALGYLR